MPLFKTPHGGHLNYVIHEPILDTPTINVVFLHGYMCNLFEWQGYNRLLVPNARLILIDLYAHGESSWVHTPTEEDMENDQHIILLLRHLNVHSYFIVGHSFGGRVAGLVTAIDKEGDSSKVLGTILITPIPISGIPPANNVFISTLGTATTPEAMTKLASLVLNNGVPLRVDLCTDFLASLRHSAFDEGSQIDIRAKILERDRASIISSITTPLLFFSGDRDFFFSATLKELALFTKTTPNVHVLFDGSHMFPVTVPVETAAVINKFILKHNK